MRPFQFVLVFVLALSINALAQSNVKPDDKTIAILKQFRAEYCKSKQTKNLQLIQQQYADDIRLMPEFQKTIMGKNNVLLYETAFSKRFDIATYNRKEIEILDLGTRVIETGTFAMEISLRGGQQQNVNGKYIDVWQKESTGKMTLVTEAWNYDQGLPFENELKFEEIPSVNIALQAHLPVNNPVSFELAALNALMEKVITEHDPKIWSQFYSDDGMFLYSRHAVTQHKKDIGDFFDNHVKDLPVFEKLDVRNDRIDDLGKYVIEYASHIAIIRAGDFSGVFTGKDLVVWRREPNGSLKIFRHIAMYD